MEVPLQSWVHFILEVMVEAIEKIHCDGIEISLLMVEQICLMKMVVGDS